MRSRSRLTTAAALAVSTAALASPAMGAPYQDLRSADAKDAARQATMQPRHMLGIRDSLAATVSPRLHEAQVVSPTASGFDWGSAAVGAGATLGLSAISLGGIVGLRRRRLPVAPSPLAH